MLFIHRMSRAHGARNARARGSRGCSRRRSEEAGDETSGQDPTVVIYRISGALLSAPAASVGTVVGAHRRRCICNLIIDFSAVPFVDSTGAKTMEGLAHKAAQRGVGVTLTGMSEG